jgi:enhancer of polycomb-like protein
LLHSHDGTKLSSPSQSRASSVKPEAPAPSETTGAALAYHIPTPDATGLIDNTNYVKLYHTHKWVEPTNYIRFSDTVEEASCGLGGLGYCMDDEDEAWLKEFNSKAEGGSASTPTSPVQGRNERRTKGKEKEKGDGPSSLFITEDTYEYIMGVLEKHTEDTVPMLHTNLSLMPLFSQVEPLFSSPLASSFYPSNEAPSKSLPEPRVLARMARSVYPHWKARRERRQGKPVHPTLNVSHLVSTLSDPQFDETNDGDPYVCFRRRDVRAARKTRRTDNFSVDQFQKIQY